VINVIAVVLKTNQGHLGWGYSESAWQGKFKHDAWYVRNVPEVPQLEQEFTSTWWPLLKGRNPFELETERIGYASGFPHLDAAVRLALWDLMAQEKGVPLYRLLNPETPKQKALAYGSILDFPLSEKEALDLTQKFLMDGFGIIKVKIGADDVERDIKRLKLLKSYAGNDIRLTADANEAWDWETALDRIETYLKHDIQLEYIEDPLNRNDVQGFAELTKRSPLPIIGHDYVNSFEQLQKLVEIGGLKGIRTGKDIDYSMQCIRLAEQAGIPVYLGNSMFEINAHLALAFHQVNRTEFSYLATNNILATPIHFQNGWIEAPKAAGHGLFPLNDKLDEFASENILQHT
jgi:L-alanine-DL-glutamate epimerase-like enolase superfamily enzyme